MRVLLLVLCATLGVSHGGDGCCHCPALWTHWDGHCYRYFNSLRPNFEDAEEYCQSYLSHLVKIDYVEENDFIFRWWKSMREPSTPDKQFVRIGLKDDGDNWRWTDGSEAQYTNWDILQPDGDQLCGVMWRYFHGNSDSGKWDDEPCDRERAFICEFSLPQS